MPENAKIYKITKNCSIALATYSSLATITFVILWSVIIDYQCPQQLDCELRHNTMLCPQHNITYHNRSTVIQDASSTRPKCAAFFYPSNSENNTVLSMIKCRNTCYVLTSHRECHRFPCNAM